MWHFYTIEFYSTIYKNEIRLFAIKWVELETLMLNEIGEFHNDNSCVFSPVGSRGGEAIKQNGTLGMMRGGA